ncbi:Nuclear envelope morphology protein 1 [Kappamyces sp. JEL0680]|nr:Nuclear envelope morphology protein 1 [Kappamyces sp. JEL0680]
MKQGHDLIIAGTYERLLYGLNKDSTKSLSEETALLVPSFIYPAHISCITAVASTARYLATGSTDEHIKLYDLKLRKEIGNLMHHNGTITCLGWVGTTHLITASEDGLISIVRSSDWELLKTLKGHHGSVLDFAIHSSGKVLLSVGKDSTFKCWDLSRGLLSYSLKLAQAPTMVRWAGNDSYLVFSNNAIHVHSISSQSVIAKISSRSRINAGVSLAIQLADTHDPTQVVVYGGEDKTLRVARVSDGSELCCIATKHSLRIKDIAHLAASSLISSCSSDGLILVWDVQKMATDGFDVAKAGDWICGEYDCKCRLTCLEFVGGDRGYEKRNSAALAAAAAAKAAAIPESDYEDIPAAKKPKISVTFDEAADPAPTEKGNKKKQPETGHELLFNKNGSKKGSQKKIKVLKKKPSTMTWEATLHDFLEAGMLLSLYYITHYVASVISGGRGAGSLDSARTPSSTKLSTSESLQQLKAMGQESVVQRPAIDLAMDPDSPAADSFTRSRTTSLGTPRKSISSLSSSRKTLVLDLDETLVHSSLRGIRYDFMVEVMLEQQQICYYVYKRPHVDYFLQKVAEWFKIVIFTASVPEYADPVIDWLDSSRTLISKRYFRDSCTPVGASYMKDLTMVEKDLAKVCLVDNTPFCFGLFPENGIPIDTWTSDRNDEALLDLLPFLDALRFTRDVRSVLHLRIPTSEEKSQVPDPAAVPHFL